MSKLDKRIETEVTSLVEIGIRILNKAQSLSSSMAGEDLAEVSTWLTRISDAWGGKNNIA